MIPSASINAVIETYERHGWVLRRIILPGEIRQEPINIGTADVIDGELTAAWFSRPPGFGDTTWELRYLGEPPYALLIQIDESDEFADAALAEVECRLADSIAAKSKA
jgi:hypothetical protein